MKMITRKSTICFYAHLWSYKDFSAFCKAVFAFLFVFVATNVEAHATDRRSLFTVQKKNLNTPELTDKRKDIKEPSSLTFSLYNAKTGKPVEGFDPIEEGATINLAEVGKELEIVANFGKAGQAGSVALGYNKSKNFQLEEKAPYAVGLNFNLSTDENIQAIWVPVLGDNEVNAVVYAEPKARGRVLGEASISFEVVDEAVENESITFSLYNTQTGMPVAGFDPIREGDVIDLAEVGYDLEVVANLKKIDKVESITLGHDKNIQLEEVAPYRNALHKHINVGSWTPNVGKNIVFATAFSEIKAKGKELSKATLHFEIIDSEKKGEGISITAYPNPVVNALHVSSEHTEQATFTLVDPSGKVVRSGEMDRETSIDVHNLKSGLYFLKISTEAGISTEKIFIRR